MFNIQMEIKKLPDNPGVYIMKDITGQIIYVGKAINLKNRVSQYFRKNSSHDAKTRAMVPNIVEFEYIITENELEALILECNLIKKHFPKYNISLKDDRYYPFLKITINETFPRIFITREHLKDGAKYFGPFTSKYALDEIINVVHDVWKLRRCNKSVLKVSQQNRPCLNYDMGLCSAPCAGKISQEEYKKMVDEIIAFLNGKSFQIVKTMEKQMFEHSENLEFEAAAKLRDKINAVKRLSEKQTIEGEISHDRDVIAFAKQDDDALVQVFFVRFGKVSGREHFMLSGVSDSTNEEIMTEFVKQFYSDTTYIPKELILETDISDKQTINLYLNKLKEQTVLITTPQKGEKLKLVELAKNNAILSLEQYGLQLKRDAQKTVGALEEIKQALFLDFDISRIEAYDISNIQGFESVGSMVVFERGLPKRSDYRKFKIKTVVGPDDYASMEEVLLRRLSRFEFEKDKPEEQRKFSKLPDIIFIDGGAGQVTSALKVLNKLNMNIPVCGMIKDDRHRTRGLLYEGEEITLKFTSEGFKLVTRIQDEVHRFAIEYHRKLREKKQVHSMLDDIKGIGDTRRKALLKHFGDIHKIRCASLLELTEAKTMDKRAAQAVYDFFRK